MSKQFLPRPHSLRSRLSASPRWPHGKKGDPLPCKDSQVANYGVGRFPAMTHLYSWRPGSAPIIKAKLRAWCSGRVCGVDTTSAKLSARATRMDGLCYTTRASASTIRAFGGDSA
jgi:hypothetical protein